MEKLADYIKTITVRAVIIILVSTAGLIGSILMIVGIAEINAIPAWRICAQQGYPSTDCDSLNQSIYTFYPNPKCLIAASPSCLNSPPPCCVAPENITNSWNVPLGYSFLSLNQASCRDFARSTRTGIYRCGTAPPCQTSVPLGANISSSVLDDVEATAYQQCTSERLRSGFFFMYLTGPLVLVVVIILGVAARGESQSLVRLGLFGGTAVIASGLEGIRILLLLKNTVSIDGSVKCNGLESAYVSNGTFLGTFHCVDQTVGGEHKQDPAYSWIEYNSVLYYVGCGLALPSIIVLVTALFYQSPSSSSQSGIPMRRLNINNPNSYR